MDRLPQEAMNIIKNSEAIKILTTVDEDGNPHAAFREDLKILDDGNLAFGEPFEGSQTNVNLVRSLWFDKKVELTLRDRSGTTFQIIGKPYRYAHSGPLFKKFYLAEREKRGADSELAGVWIITPEKVRNETYEVRKKEEDEKHPFFRHFDRASVRKAK